MANQATVTAYAGPGRLATALVLTGVTDIEFDLTAAVLRIKSNGQEKFFALTGSNTILLTAVGGAYTLTLT